MICILLEFACMIAVIVCLMFGKVDYAILFAVIEVGFKLESTWGGDR